MTALELKMTEPQNFREMTRLGVGASMFKFGGFIFQVMWPRRGGRKVSRGGA